MKKNNDFYIGWQEAMPASTSNFLRKIVVGGLMFFILLATVVVLLQKPFSTSVFEFGNIKNITGTYLSSPVPMLVADQDQIPEGYSNNLLLIGYGKFGAKGTLQTIEANQGDLSNQKITLAGTLIYGNGKTLLELTKQEASFVEINKDASLPAFAPGPLSEVEVYGEVIDPKCYFGVMKPGEGKVHKSCAIRCISGGIPPVLRHITGNEDQPYRFYILLGPEGEDINADILPYVAEQVKITGQTQKVLDWDILYLDPNQIKIQ